MRIAGAIFICLSGLYLSSLLVSGERARCRCVASLLALVEKTQALVESYSMSASQILASLDPELLRSCAYFGAMPPKSFSELSECCEICDSEAREIFCAFAEDFGKNHRIRQAQKCTLCAEALRRRADELAEETSRRKRLISVLCICLSLVAVILLL